MRKFAISLTISAAALAAGAVPAGAATQIGATGTPVDSTTYDGVVYQQTTDPSSGAKSYAAPAAGVITSFSYQASSIVAPIKLKVLRGTGIPNQWLFVGESAPQSPVPNAVNSFTARIAVQAGDVLGNFTHDDVPTAMSIPGPTNVLGGFANGLDPAPGQTATILGTTTNYVLDLAASLEADADGDGYGDETQDKCPTDKSTQGACPDKTAPLLTVSLKKRQRTLSKLKLALTANEAATATVKGTIKLPKASKARKSAKRTVQLTGAKALLANAKTSMALKLPAKAKRKLRSGKSLTAKLTIVAKDAAGNATTKKAKVKLLAKRKRR